MAEQIDKPHLITKPIQLLAAWLVGLSVIDASFLGAAKLMGTEHWECGALVVASIFNVPIFIGALFLLQTKFRPEMQEDAFYFDYINKKTGTSTQINKINLLEKQIEEILHNVEKSRTKSKEGDFPSTSFEEPNHPRVALNDYLPFYQEIRRSLRVNEIKINSIFGKINKTDHKPSAWIVVVTDDLEPEQILPVLKICCDFPFDGMVMAPRELDEGDTEDIYIGAYGPLEKLIPFTPEVIGEIRTATSGEDLRFITSRS